MIIGLFFMYLMDSNGEVEYKTYLETHEGIVRSYIERISYVDTTFYQEWKKDAHKFRINL